MLALNDRTDELVMREPRVLDRPGSSVVGDDRTVVLQMPSFAQLVKAGFAFTLGSLLMVVIGWVVWLTFLFGALSAFLQR